MTYATSKELYRMFLDSQFWKKTAETKKNEVGKCERCGCPDFLQAHHKRYRSNWFDTQMDDLEVLCRRCHEKHHGITPPKPNRKKPRKRKAKRSNPKPSKPEVWNGSAWVARPVCVVNKLPHKHKPWHYAKKGNHRWSNRGSSTN